MKRTSRPMQHASSMHAARCTDESRYPIISGNINNKRKEAQEPGANPKRTPNAQATNKAKQTRADKKLQSNVSTHRYHDTGMLWKCNKAGCSRPYAKPVLLTNQ